MAKDSINRTLFDKIFRATVSSWLHGNSSDVSFTGSAQEMNALVEVLSATKEFQDELMSESATVDSVLKKLSNKHVAANKFFETTGRHWPI